MIPKIIHQTARSIDISWEERRLVKRMQWKLYDWNYMFHDDNNNENLIAEYFPQYLSRFRKIPKGVAKADICRLVYMYVYGGFYFDTDYKLFSKIPSWMLEYESLLMESRNSPTEYKLGNAILASSPGCIFFKDLICYIFEKGELENLAENRVELVTGPEAVTDFYLKNKDSYKNIVEIIPRRFFNPPTYLRGFYIKKSDDCIGAHLCWSSWRSGSILNRMLILFQRKLQALL